MMRAVQMLDQLGERPAGRYNRAHARCFGKRLRHAHNVVARSKRRGAPITSRVCVASRRQSETRPVSVPNCTVTIVTAHS